MCLIFITYRQRKFIIFAIINLGAENYSANLRFV